MKHFLKEEQYSDFARCVRPIFGNCEEDSEMKLKTLLIAAALLFSLAAWGQEATPRDPMTPPVHTKRVTHHKKHRKAHSKHHRAA